MENLVEQKYIVPDSVKPLMLYGHRDENLRLIEGHFNVRLIARGNTIKIIGTEEEIKIIKNIFDDLIHSFEKKKILSKDDVETAINIAKISKSDQSGNIKISEYNNEIILKANEGYIKPKSKGQSELLNSFKHNDIVFAIGPAGTGKTYLAVAMAVAYLNNNRIKKIVLARPAVEAGESLGYLPGDFKEKIDPYLKPLYDALEDMIPIDLLKKYLDQGIIEIIPLAYMRGRTLNNAFVILDEAQNSTFMQMKMFLTRLGSNAKAVITGDITQIDLPVKKDSGLVSSIRVLSDIKGIDFVKLTRNDVVRHYLVKEIIDAYDKYASANEK